MILIIFSTCVLMHEPDSKRELLSMKQITSHYQMEADIIFGGYNFRDCIEK